VTHLAKKLYPGFNESNFVKLKGCPPVDPLVHDLAYLSRLEYVAMVENNGRAYWNWLLQGRVLYRLPSEDGGERLFKRVAPFKKQRSA